MSVVSGVAGNRRGELDGLAIGSPTDSLWPLSLLRSAAMKLLLLDSPPEVEQFAAWLSDVEGYECITTPTVPGAIELLLDGGIEAVVLSASFAGDRAGVAKILDHCEPGNPSVLLVLDDFDDLGRLEVATNDVVEDFLVRPLSATALRARLAVVRRRRSSIFVPRQALLAALPDLMFRIGRDGTYIDYHFPSPELTYVPGNELEGANIADVLPPRVAERFLAAIGEVLNSKEPGTLEYELPAVEGIHAYEARIVPSGEDEVLVIVRDVTDRKRMEEALRTAAKVKQAFSSAVVHAQEAERQQLSRELHDGIGQILLVHRMDAEWLADNAEADATREAAEGLCASLDKTLEAVRNLAMDLRPPAIDDLGIGSALKTLVANLGRRSGIECKVDIQPDVARVDSNASVTLYRIAQEALANAIRHASCQNILVSLDGHNGTVELRVRDDGVGFNPDETDSSSSIGLVSMKERADLIGGHVTIESGANQGTCVKVSVPTYRKELGSTR